MAQKSKKTQVPRQSLAQAEKEFAGFRKDYLKFLSEIAKVRKQQFLLMKEIAKKSDQYKLSKLKK